MKPSRELTWKYVVSTVAHKQLWESEGGSTAQLPPLVTKLGFSFSLAEAQSPKSEEVPAALVIRGFLCDVAAFSDPHSC